MKNNEKKLRDIITKHIGNYITRKQLRLFIYKYNDHKNSISKCITEIITNPSDFINLIYLSPEIKLINHEK